MQRLCPENAFNAHLLTNFNENPSSSANAEIETNNCSNPNISYRTSTISNPHIGYDVTQPTQSWRTHDANDHTAAVDINASTQNMSGYYVDLSTAAQLVERYLKR